MLTLIQPAAVWRGILTRLQEALGISELNESTVAMIAGMGIAMSAATVILPAAVVGVLGAIMGVVDVVQSVFMIAAAAEGIYSTAAGTGTVYDKAEAFAHDTALMMVSIFDIWQSVPEIRNCLSICRSAAEGLIGCAVCLTPSEMIHNSKAPRMISSLDNFLDYTKGFLDEDALQYAREMLDNDADDIAQLKKIAQLIEDGNEKVGRKLSKEELKAGLDALWNDGGVEGALTLIERVAKLASVPREKKLALALDGCLDDFAKQRNAHTWKDFPDRDNWKQGVIDAMLDPDTEIVFDLDNIDNPWSAAMRATRGGQGATDWELLQIKSSPEMWDRVTWYRNGSIVPNPFE